MADRTIGQSINTWVQIFALILAGIWAIYNFIYKEIIKPKLLPSHISIKLDLSKAGKRNSLLAVKADFTILNNSKRKAVLLPSVYAVWGARNTRQLKKKGAKEQEYAILRNLQNMFIDTRDEMTSLVGSKVEKTFVASGPVFKGWYFDSHESATKSLVIFVPDNTYDYIEMTGYFAVVNDETDIDEAEWNIFKDGSSYSVMFFKPSSSSKKERVKIDPNNKLDAQYLLQLDYGTLTTNAILSLLD